MASSTVNSVFGAETTSASENLAQNWWLFLLRGILGILFGVVALIFPGPTMLSLVLLFSAYTLVDGVAGIISAVRAIRRKEERWGWLIFEGAVNIAVAILAFLWPGMTVLAFVLLVAAWAIVSGALMTAAAFRLNVSHGRWWLVLGGLLSVGYGALLVATPLIGAIVLTWWMGAYAIAFGVALVILSFKLKLRLRQNQQINRTAARTAA
ncbi:HdeD family acid-resistance protein [Bradyrhizobium rifense]|uniref:HdeD family acid-resistance protein n=1 Tax=Bradyrhizobium rifense TaxID=515499 RepID=A0A5D3KRD8_9BRAD|nr:HdeD family acid-resistance protein [Bradyrhizobium rifense]TYL99159.1 HdeD family acid-resistance protein [Bradyrhizobium rifense]